MFIWRKTSASCLKTVTHFGIIYPFKQGAGLEKKEVNVYVQNVSRRKYINR